MMMKKCLFLLLTAVCLIIPGYTQQWFPSVTDDFEDGYGDWTEADIDSKYYVYLGFGFNKAYQGNAAVELQKNDVANADSLGDDLFLDDITLSGTQSLSTPTASEPLFKPVGYGKAATGGRGGRVIKVTNLADDGKSGTFRAACLAKGPRIVIFEVSGVITLLSPLTITEGNITIAGQTAPGNGITLVNGPDNDRPSLKIKAENVIVQYLKIRTGDAMDQNPEESDNNVDAITVTNGGKRVIIDHLSLSWAIDETIQLWSAQDVTVQKCIISESLTYSIHPKTTEAGQAHGCAILVGQEDKKEGIPKRPGGNVSIYQNLMAHNSRRNPRLKCELPVEVTNNIIYNSGGAPWGLHQPIVVADDPVEIAGGYDFVNNYLKPGPSTGSTVTSYLGYPKQLIGDVPPLKNKDTRIYVDGNYLPDNTAPVRSSLTSYVTTAPTSNTQIPVLKATDAYQEVLDDVGDCWRLNSDGSKTFRRDALDTRWVDDVKNGTGEWVNTPRDLPPHTEGVANVDSDDDGMPDDYEGLYSFLNKKDSLDGNLDEDGDGITNVEEFLFGMSPGNASSDPSGNVTVRARGTSGTEQIEVRYNDQRVGERITLSTTYQEHKVQVNNANGNFKIAFVNDASGRDVYIDWLQVGSTRRQAESRATNTGAWANGECGGGTRTEVLHCNGYIDFGTMSSGAPIGQTIWLRSQRSGNFVTANLNVTNSPLTAAWATSIQDWERFVVIRAEAGRIALRSAANDQYVATENNRTDKLLRANRDAVGEWEQYQWINNSDGTVSLKAQVNGQYVQVTSNGDVQAINNAITSDTKFTWGVATNARIAVSDTKATISEPSARAKVFRSYPNPAHAQLTVEAEDSDDYQVTLYDMTGRLMIQHSHLKGRIQLDISHVRPGIYIIKMRDSEQQEVRQRVVIE